MKHSIILHRNKFGIDQLNLEHTSDNELNGRHEIWYSITHKSLDDPEADNGGTSQHPYGFIDKDTVTNIIESLQDFLKVM